MSSGLQFGNGASGYCVKGGLRGEEGVPVSTENAVVENPPVGDCDVRMENKGSV